MYSSFFAQGAVVCTGPVDHHIPLRLPCPGTTETERPPSVLRESPLLKICFQRTVTAVFPSL